MESQKAGKAVFKHVRIIRATVPLTAIFPDTLPHLHSPNRVVELSALKANEIKMAADIIYSCAPSEVSNVCVQAHSLKEGLVLKSYKGSSTEDRVGSIALAGNHFLLGAMQTKPFIVVWLLQKVRLPMHSYSLHLILHFSGVTYTTVLHLHALPHPQEHPYLRIACSGKVEAIACSPDGTLCAAGINEKVYIWEVREGGTAVLPPIHSHIVSGSRNPFLSCNSVM